jgi:murein DD-endopeptidase MepM/ murein hydrolase activator NlpD
LVWKLATAAVLVGIAGCSHGVYHRVRSGENLYRISKAYGVSAKRLAEANHLSDPSRIEVGQRLLIPGGRRELPVDIITPRATSVQPLQREPAPIGAAALVWPLVGGTVTSGFGQRGRSFHDGIDISAPVGASVRAAADGEVLYSDTLRGYGNVIILRHAHGLATVYAHNQTNRVRDGQQVRRGDVIGTVGETGRTAGSNLHFEVRQDNVARDPLYFLPAVEQVAVPAPHAGHGG